MNFKDYYKFPLSIWKSCDIKVFTKDNVMAFDFAFSIGNIKPAHNLKLEQKEKIVRILNGSEEKLKKQHNFSYKNGTIYIDNIAFIVIRGWGHLTGSLNLDTKKAREIQDEFADYIIKKLSKNETTN